MIIDTHAHIYPDKIALRASKSIEAFYDLEVVDDGTVGRLLAEGAEAGVDRFLVHSVATTPEQVERINDFIAATVSSMPDHFVGFCAMHQDYSDPGPELDRMLAHGIKGIKLHPDFQRFNIDDACIYPVYLAAIERNMPILIHLGDHRYEYSKAERLARVLDRFPELTVIGAHLGGWSEWDHAAAVLKGSGIYVDTSSSLAFMTPEHACELIHTYGADHVLFASDYPMWRPKDELARFMKIPLTEAECDLILHANAERLLGL